MSYTVIVRGIQVRCDSAEDAAKLVRLLDDGAALSRAYIEGGIQALEKLKEKLLQETADVAAQSASDCAEVQTALGLELS